MDIKKIVITALTLIFFTTASKALEFKNFNIENDLLLVHFDCKTDVDDIHSAAALANLMSVDDFARINYHAVAGTYGIQEGLYVPPNDLFKLAFAGNWTDAHKDFNSAVKKVRDLSSQTLKNGGDIWIADAGQSDFTAGLIKAIQASLPELNVAEQIHVVQHSDWNEEVTDPKKLAFVKATADYHKIPDGNAVGNGSPGFRNPEHRDLLQNLSNQKNKEIWALAIEIGNKYNGKDGRYNNEAIEAGGLDFSDLSEVCYILGITDIKDTQEFFLKYTD